MTIALSGLVILVISIVGALLSGRSAAGQPRQVRILRFALFFWLFAFVQLVIAALGYALLTR